MCGAHTHGDVFSRRIDPNQPREHSVERLGHRPRIDAMIIWSLADPTRWARFLYAMLGALALAAPINAAGLDAKQVAKSREETFHTLGKAAKSLTDELARSSPNWRIVADEAVAIERLAAELPDWFPAGSDPAAGVKTSALEAVWSKSQEFKQAADRFAIEAQKMTQLAPAGGIAACRVQAKVLNEACRACHRNFRSRW